MVPQNWNISVERTNLLRVNSVVSEMGGICVEPERVGSDGEPNVPTGLATPTHSQNTHCEGLEGPLRASGEAGLGGDGPPLGTPLWVSFHPAAGLRPGKSNLIKELRDDLARILFHGVSANTVDGGDPSGPVVPLGAVSTEKVVTVDIETSGFFKDGKALPFSGGEILLIGAEEG